MFSQSEILDISNSLQSISSEEETSSEAEATLELP